MSKSEKIRDSFMYSLYDYVVFEYVYYFDYDKLQLSSYNSSKKMFIFLLFLLNLCCFRKFVFKSQLVSSFLYNSQFNVKY